MSVLMYQTGILGFASHKTFEDTTYDEICQAFLRRSKKGWKTLQTRTFQLQTSTFYLLTMNRLGDYDVFKLQSL